MLCGGAMTPGVGGPADRAQALVMPEWASAPYNLSPFSPRLPHPADGPFSFSPRAGVRLDPGPAILPG